jgi:hypothetical protein
LPFIARFDIFDILLIVPLAMLLMFDIVPLAMFDMLLMVEFAMLLMFDIVPLAMLLIVALFDMLLIVVLPVVLAVVFALLVLVLVLAVSQAKPNAAKAKIPERAKVFFILVFSCVFLSIFYYFCSKQPSRSSATIWERLTI